MGGGGYGRSTSNTGVLNGSLGLVYGGGGGGAVKLGAAGSSNGGDGANGLVIVELYA